MERLGRFLPVDNSSFHPQRSRAVREFRNSLFVILNTTPFCGFYPIRGTLDRASPCVNHLPGHVLRRITGEEDYYTSGIVGLIDFRYSRRYSPLAPH